MCKNLICVCIFGKSLNIFQKIQKSLNEKYKSTTFQDPPKKIFSPAAGRRLRQAWQNNPVGLSAENHTGLFLVDGWEGGRRPPKKFFGRGFWNFSEILEKGFCIFEDFFVLPKVQKILCQKVPEKNKYLYIVYITIYHNK
jgi:hypothetical protein